MIETEKQFRGEIAKVVHDRLRKITSTRMTLTTCSSGPMILWYDTSLIEASECSIIFLAENVKYKVRGYQDPIVKYFDYADPNFPQNLIEAVENAR